MIKKVTIPTILGMIVLLVGVFAGVYFLKSTQIFKIGASADATPKDIRVTNITDSSITISWTTDKETFGFITWGDSQGNTNKILKDGEKSQKTYNHFLSLTGLQPNTTYYYKINSDGTNFDNGGIPWQFTTGSSLNPSKNSTLLSGNIISATGEPEIGALVYANIDGYTLSTQTSETGNFVFQLGNARTLDLKNYAQIGMDSTLVQISVVAPPDGVASAQIFPQSGNPIPTIIIGQVYDFRSSPANNSGKNPNTNLSLPENATQESKFDVDIPSSTPKPTTVILESLNEGEVITSQKPQFFGKGPSGESIKITVHSDEEILATVEIPSSGSWSYSVPENLSPGDHSVTISWIDASGITRFLTRNFVVKAGEAPAFTASESGATTTPTPNINATGTATPKASVKPSPTATATAMPVPVTGNLTPTLILSIMGLVVISFSFAIWKMTEI